jgi:hypothetical protein
MNLQLAGGFDEGCRKALIALAKKQNKMEWNEEKFGFVSPSWNFFTVHQTHGEMTLTALAHLLSKSGR